MMQAYAEYKDSGVDWLGEIPTSWNVKPGMVAFTENKRNNKGMKEDQVLSLSYGKIIIKPKEKLVGLVPESFETYQIIEAGDIIIRGTDLQNDKTSLRTGLAKDEGIITSAYLSLRVRPDFNSRFLHYYLHSLDTTKVIYRFGTGLRQNLGFEDFKRLPVFDIPLTVQTAIADFLDDKITKVEALVGIKRRQIELLAERKQILIQNAVTKGLNPDAPMKDSGVDWIGDIPAHWEVKRFKHFTKIHSGYSPEQVNPNAADDITYYKVDDLNYTDENGVLGKGKWAISKRLRINLCPEGVLLIPKRGGAIATNKIGLTPKRCSFDTNVMGLEIDEAKAFRDLIAVWLRHRNLISIADITTLPQINNKHIDPLEIALPDIKEQKEIFDYISEVTGKIQSLENLKNNQITKLNEYKTTLINAAVTGKIKVA